MRWFSSLMDIWPSGMIHRGMKVNKIRTNPLFWHPHALCLGIRRALSSGDTARKSHYSQSVTVWCDSVLLQSGLTDQNSLLIDKHGRTKATGPAATSSTGSFSFPLKVPVHLLKITVKALLQIGGGVNYVSRVRTTAQLPRLLHAHSLAQAVV